MPTDFYDLITELRIASDPTPQCGRRDELRTVKSRSNVAVVVTTAVVAASLSAGMGTAPQAWAAAIPADASATATEQQQQTQNAQGQAFPACRNDSLALSRMAVGNSYNATCYQITNQTQVFTAPNTLTTGTYQTKDAVTNVPQTQCFNLPSAGSTPGQLASFTETGWLQDICQSYRPEFRFVPPQPLPQLATTNLAAQSNNATSDWNYSAQCGYISWWQDINNLNPYTDCSIETISDPGAPDNPAADIQVTTRNFPVTVEIHNKLNGTPDSPDDYSIVLNGTPMTQNMILDLNGGYPQTLKIGDVGYYGLYATRPATLPGAPGADPAKSFDGQQSLAGFSALYQVAGSGSSGLQNSQIWINIFLDTFNGTLDPSSGCAGLGSGSGNQAFCSLNLEGSKNTPKRVIVNIHE